MNPEIGMRFTDGRPYIHDFVLLPNGRESFEVMNFSKMKVTSSAGKPYDFSTNVSLIIRSLVNFYTT